MSVRFSFRCRYIASPFANCEDLSWRLLLRKYGVQLCYTPPLDSLELLRKAPFNSKPFDHSIKGEDRPLILQLYSEDPADAVTAVKRLRESYDAVDISYQNYSYHEAQLNKDIDWEKVNSWLQLIQSVYKECGEMAVVCKLPFSQHTVSETIRQGNLLQEAGCQLLLLYRCTPENVGAVVTRKDWEVVKTIRESVSVPLVVDVGSSSLGEVDRCLEYTGVQGIAVSGSLESNPALFCKKQPLVSEVIEQYLNLCDHYPTPLSNIKNHINKFCGYYLSNFHNLRTNLMEAETMQDIRCLVGQLNSELSHLSKKELKSLVRLKEKKDCFRRVSDIKKEEKRFAKRLETRSDIVERIETHIPKIAVKKLQRERVEHAMKNKGQRVAIDFTLSEEMSNKEVNKLAGQVRRLYGSNMKSVCPFHLHFTGLPKSGRVYDACVRQAMNFDNFLVEMLEESFHGLFHSADVVYLTPDSPHVLETINPEKVYIIGGLVDHHVLKEKTLGRANIDKLETARLPIDEYMERTKDTGNYSFSKVLTVNQVFDILLNFHETQDWPSALTAGVPPRKGLVLKEP